MAADGASSVPAFRPRPTRNPISGPLLDKIFARALAALGIVFGLQSIPSLIAQQGSMQPAWGWIISIAVFGGILAVGVASVFMRGIETAAAFVAISFLVALVTWPLAVRDPTTVLPQSPWLYYLISVATSAAAIAFSRWIATVYLILAPTIYGLIELTPSGGGLLPFWASLDTIYSVILGGAVLILIILLRQASAAVDGAQNMAVARYSGAIREHATELERVQVDAIVHDSVLTTFISAARAYSPDEMALATTMARNAMSHLTTSASVTPFDESSTSLTSMQERIEVLIDGLGAEVEVSSKGLDDHSIPAGAAEALYSAAVQAVVNSVQHAGGDDVSRWVSLKWAGGRVRVEVGDTGSGFNPAAVPGERLGVRVSITERLSNAGGEATIHTKTGSGTVIDLAWPRQAPRAEEPDAAESIPERSIPEHATVQQEIS
ncbi:signal transduction histidine kinase [Frondihabitans sp. PhB188]|uniref:sensor histidine kinase n=1 Tax=Frondihabitans sp. PhB188 TaxID=2485200 RepID=UPI000FC01640|nr:ATP-binding protein [Frondihabitans sp. PhB188]ROQ36668.1 signal transduction histidine kinase [Frondihabitans sp. PhB188]